MALNIVLFEPEIPNNTGNIGRLSLATGSVLHLVKPYGFEINDARLKRAGLDYWKHISIYEYDNIEDFYCQHIDAKMVYFSSNGIKSFWKINFVDNLFLIFGKESLGLSKSIIQKNKNETYQIPLFSNHIRSLNISNSVGIVVYEGLRQINK
tara:strand:- start:18967 stop:19422 length:456 start_codon:yes stop_codon:yes gene_type:complete